jgi:hypothetical protein
MKKPSSMHASEWAEGLCDAWVYSTKHHSPAARVLVAAGCGVAPHCPAEHGLCAWIAAWLRLLLLLLLLLFSGSCHVTVVLLLPPFASAAPAVCCTAHLPISFRLLLQVGHCSLAACGV